MALLQHGQTNNRVIKTGDGCEHIQPEVYCVLHGWVQAFQFRAHEICDRLPKPRNGAEFEKPKAFKAAA